jgi:hypothetical protein
MKPVQKLGLLFACVLVLPYFSLVVYLALPEPPNLGTLPALARWGLLAYLLASVAVLAIGVRKFKRSRINVTPSAEASAQGSPAIYPLKRLLIMYMISFPIGVIAVFAQKVVPVKFALLGLIVSLLIMGATWRSLSLIKRHSGR